MKSWGKIFLINGVRATINFELWSYIRITQEKTNRQMSFMFILFHCIGFARVDSISSHIIDDIDIDCETHPARSVFLYLLSSRQNK